MDKVEKYKEIENLLVGGFLSQEEANRLKAEIIQGNAIDEIEHSNDQFKKVKIFNQIWMVENLNVSNFKNGDAIHEAKTNDEWTKAGVEEKAAWCHCNNDAENDRVYGKLYNWYAVIDPRGLAPSGWHVPTDEEWSTLLNYLGGESVACGKLKETGTTHWASPNTGATNEIGFTALPGGHRFLNGSFYGIGSSGDWWTSTKNSTGGFAISRGIYYGSDWDYRGEDNKQNGYSVRCLKDN
jgi:uncharacterized protein (TIGR02145 family)